MNAQQIEKILKELKADKNGRIRGKGRASDRLMSLSLNEKDEILSDFIRNWIDEFPEQNWEYIDFMKQRVMDNQ
jgi:hypothetical protein